MRRTSPLETLVSLRYAPLSRTSAVDPCRRRANLISSSDVPGFPLLSPRARIVEVFDTVNSTNPSPDRICCVETAPASLQPAQPPVFVSVEPTADALTRLVHCTS